MRFALFVGRTEGAALSHLRRIAVDKLKIDRSFVRSLGMTEDAGAIIAAVVGIGQSLGLDTTAEGVETAEQQRLLQAVGCTEMQGFLYSRPLPACAFVEALGRPKAAA